MKELESELHFHQDEQDSQKNTFKARTLSRKQLRRDHKQSIKRGDLLQIIQDSHPKTRSDCCKVARPCLYVSCRHNLYLDVNPDTGSVKFNFPDKEVWELEETCALDVAERGGVTLEEVGQMLNITRERVRQIELEALAKLRLDGSDDLSFDEPLAWDNDMVEKKLERK